MKPMKKATRLLLFLFLFFNCTVPENFDPPVFVDLPKFPKANTTLQAIWERVQQSETGFMMFEKQETELWAMGIVSSSDATGNFYKELYVQNSEKAPKRALRLLLDQRSLHAQFPVGRKILIRLNGLGAGMHKGVLSLGTYQADGIAPLPEPLITDHIIRTDQTLVIDPVVTSLAELNTNLIGKWVRLPEIQFAKSEHGKTFSGEAFDTFDGERRLMDCDEQRSIMLSSSSFSKFKSVVIPSLSGTINGILTRDYYNEKYILKINDPNDMTFETARCDPYFEETFEEVSLGRFEKVGWQNVIESGTQAWEVYEDANSLGQSLRIGSYRSKDKKTVAWLITPAFDLTALAGASFHFRTSTQYADKSKLEVLLSTDYNGEQSQLKKATWKTLETRIATGEDNDNLWIDSSPILLPQEAGTLYFAFRYSGSGKTAYDGTFELDDLRLTKATSF